MSIMPYRTKRGVFIEVEASPLKCQSEILSCDELLAFQKLDSIYRQLVSIMFNFVPTSGHPGGSISSGCISQALLFDGLDYDISNPLRDDADVFSYAAGHKALGLYALWALRDEIIKQGDPTLLPQNNQFRLRFEDLLGFRRNPKSQTPLFIQFNSKPLDGHPTPRTPFVRLATGASGVGMASSIGLALSLADYYREHTPRVHILEGEGGLTPGRVSEALATAGTASLNNVVLHVDWNQSSIDSDRVCRLNDLPGDYVQWDPLELCYLHDWNVIFVPDGHDFYQVVSAQRQAMSLKTPQPTAIIYRTVKGKDYGIEGCRSHGAGHKFCSSEFFATLNELQASTKINLACSEKTQNCTDGKNKDTVEQCYWVMLGALRELIRNNKDLISIMCIRVAASQTRLLKHNRKAHKNAPRLDQVFREAERLSDGSACPVTFQPGTTTTLRDSLAQTLAYLNQKSSGCLLIASADLLGSTSIGKIADHFSPGYFNVMTNPNSRTIGTGGICEDAMSGILSGLSMSGHYIGVGASYGAFLAPLGHISARLHAISNQAWQNMSGDSYRPMILVCAHAGIETGEDGPTHADPQCLQLFQENFPLGTLITLTPWDPQEIPVLLGEALRKKPAVIVIYVTRPGKTVLDRNLLGLTPPTHATNGLYLLRKAKRQADGVVVLQGSEVTYAFLQKTIPLLEDARIELNVFYVSSAELFDLLPENKRLEIYPQEARERAMGITGFTLPTLYRWISTERGRFASLHPFVKGFFLGSGDADMVLSEAGLDGEKQFAQIQRFIRGET